MDEKLRAELLRRMELDQAARRAFDGEDWEPVRLVDDENLPWLKEVIGAYGWPGASLVGTDGAHAAWLLVQHAVADIPFMRHCLGLMTTAVAAGEASCTDLAYLTDRVQLHEGGQQEYGTQLTRRGGQWVPDNTRDPDRLDERRATVDLPPMAELLALMAGEPALSRLQCNACKAWVPYEPPDFGESVTITCDGCGREMTIVGPPQRRASGTAG